MTIRYKFTRNDDKHCVYFISFGTKDNVPVKIGYSKNVLKRLQTLQTSCPFKLKLIMALPFETEEQAKKAEHFLHYKFKGWSMQGEWFDWKRCSKYLPKFISEFYELYVDKDVYAELKLEKFKTRSREDIEIQSLKNQVNKLIKEVLILRQGTS